MVTTQEPNSNWVAWSACCTAREDWLIGDPLRFVDLHLTGLAPNICENLPNSPSVLCITRPKPSGGTRLEAFPDIASSAFLQRSAFDLLASVSMPSASLSAKLFGVRLRGSDPYEVWAASVPNWIRRCLAVGNAVLALDVENFFESISPERFETALLEWNVARKHATLELVQTIRRLADHDGHRFRGLPVCPDELFFLVADLVLATVDECIRREAGAVDYVRWVDDLYVAIPHRRLEACLESITHILGKDGFRLSPAKTCRLTTLRAFQQHWFENEHSELDRLGAAAKYTTAPDMAAILRRLRGVAISRQSHEAGRLVKRLYGLAGMVRDPALLEHVGEDLTTFPHAAISIVNFVASSAKEPSETALLGSCLRQRLFDSTKICTLRGLFAYPPDASVWRELRKDVANIALGSKSEEHEYAQVLAMGLLARGGDLPYPLQAIERVTQMLDATCRRVSGSNFSLL